jgi:hypothetical protein
MCKILGDQESWAAALPPLKKDRHILISHFPRPPHGVMLSFYPTTARGNANGISEFIKQKEKRGCYCARCLCTRHIKAAVSAAERKFKGETR